MTDDEIIQTYLKHMVKIGSIKFGWYEDITTYTYLKSSISTKYHPDSGGVIIIECQYMEKDTLHNRAIEVKRDDMLQVIRAEKLNQLL